MEKAESDAKLEIGRTVLMTRAKLKPQLRCPRMFATAHGPPVSVAVAMLVQNHGRLAGQVPCGVDPSVQLVHSYDGTRADPFMVAMPIASTS